VQRRSIAYFAYAALVAAAFAVAGASPLTFQKLNTLRPAPDGIPELESDAGGYVDVAALLRPIPLHGAQVWEIDPAARHRLTVVEGGGNCSQISFGLAYQLEREGVDYQIIHMFSHDGLGKGDGHTVVRLPYRLDGEERVGLVDASFGGVLSGAEGPLDVAELEAAPVAGWGQIDLNANARFPDYHDDFLVDAVLGYVPPSEVREYYAFLERFHVPLGSPRLEKYVFDGAALVLGRLPLVFVPAYDALMAGRGAELALHRGALAVLRSTLVVVPLALLYEGLRRRRRP